MNLFFKITITEHSIRRMEPSLTLYYPISDIQNLFVGYMASLIKA